MRIRKARLNGVHIPFTLPHMAPAVSGLAAVVTHAPTHAQKSYISKLFSVRQRSSENKFIYIYIYRPIIFVISPSETKYREHKNALIICTMALLHCKYYNL